jgi:hypothetical protein
MARCVEAEEVGVERAAAVRLGGRRRSVEEHGAHGARQCRLRSRQCSGRRGDIGRSAGVDKLHEPLAVQLPRRVRSARYRPQVDDAEDFADLLSPRSKLVGEDMLNVAEIRGRECDLERHRLYGRTASRHGRLALSWPAEVSAR